MLHPRNAMVLVLVSSACLNDLGVDDLKTPVSSPEVALDSPVDDTDHAMETAGVPSPHRPPTDIAHVPADTLNNTCTCNFTDFVIDGSGRVIAVTTLSGTDYLYVCDGDDPIIVSGHLDYNIAAVTVDPLAERLVVAYSTGTALGVEQPDGSYPPVGDFQTTPSRFTERYMTTGPSAIAMDGTGCIWVPNGGGAGTMTCLDTQGSATHHLTEAEPLEAVDIAPDGSLWVTAGADIYAFTPGQSLSGPAHSAPNSILDLAVDFDGTFLVEIIGGEIWRLHPDGTSTRLAEVEGQGKLRITADGHLMRMRVAPNGAYACTEPYATFTSWPLDPVP